MNSQDSRQVLHTETPDLTPDMGPQRRGDTAMWFRTIVLGLAAIAFTTAGARVVPALCWMPLVALGFPAAHGAWSIFTTFRDRVDAPRSHNMLAGELGFDLICACRGVVGTAFFAPDSVVHGGATTFYLFLENYMSRHRIVNVRLGHLPGIGRPEATRMTLRLAAGQAAVYVMPVLVKPDIDAGFHRLSVQLTVDQPAGVGQRLQGARTRIHDLGLLRIAAPFELASGRPATSAPQTGQTQPRYLSLASISEKEPATARLHELLGNA